jgi:hypothetical protein
MVVCRKQRPATDRVMKVLSDTPGDAQAVESRGSSADLVQYDQARGGRVVQKVGGLFHLGHEGGLAFRKIIVGPDPGK